MSNINYELMNKSILQETERLKKIQEDYLTGLKLLEELRDKLINDEIDALSEHSSVLETLDTIHNYKIYNVQDNIKLFSRAKAYEILLNKLSLISQEYTSNLSIKETNFYNPCLEINYKDEPLLEINIEKKKFKEKTSIILIELQEKINISERRINELKSYKQKNNSKKSFFIKNSTSKFLNEINKLIEEEEYNIISLENKIKASKNMHREEIYDEVINTITTILKEVGYDYL